MLIYSMCLFIFLQTFLLHQVASRPKLLSPPWKVLRHGTALTSFPPPTPVSSRQHGGPSANSLCKVSKFARYLSSIHLGLENTWWKIFKPIPTVNIYKQLDDFLFLTLMMTILEGNRTHRIESQESRLSLKSIGKVSLQMGVSV